MLHSVFARSALATRLFNVTVTNVPGPQSPLYAFGARMEEMWPLVPLAAEHSVGIAVVSYDGKVFFGLNGDERAPRTSRCSAQGIESAITELVELAATGHALPALAERWFFGAVRRGVGSAHGGRRDEQAANDVRIPAMSPERIMSVLEPAQADEFETPSRAGAHCSTRA